MFLRALRERQSFLSLERNFTFALYSLTDRDGFRSVRMAMLQDSIRIFSTGNDRHAN